MQQLTAEEVEQAFVETAREQVNGEPFNWNRLAVIINERLADGRTTALAGRGLMIWDQR